MTDPDKVSEVELQLEDIGAAVRAAAGTGDGIVPPRGSPEDLEFEAALDELVNRRNRRNR